MALKNWRFRTVLAIVVSIVATLPLLIFGSIELYRKASQVKTSHDEQMVFLLNRLEIETKNSLEKFIFSADSAGKILLETASNQTLQDKVLTSYHVNHGIEIFAMADKYGHVNKLFKNTEFKALNKDQFFRVKVKNVVTQKETFVGIFHDETSDGGRSPIFIHPLISLKGELQGILIGKFKLGFLQNILELVPNLGGICQWTFGLIV